jgi:spore coat-associated protein N
MTSHKRPRSPISLRMKVLATVGAVGATASVAGLGTFGTFTSTTTAQAPTYASGTVVLDYGVGGTTNRLATGASLMAPGDTSARMFTLRNNGTLAMANTTLNVSATTSSLLNSDATNGLTLKIDKCSVAWVETGVSAPFTYTCGGTTTAILAATPLATVISTPPVISTNLSSFTAAGTDNLVATFTLPSVAANTVQGLSSALSLTFTGTQRAATSV